MEKKIEEQINGSSPSQIKELNLDDCKSTSIVGLTDEYANLEVLSFINAGLTSLKGFPKLPKLRKLELSDNKISNGLEILAESPGLTHLTLCGNKLKDLIVLEPLKELKNLKSLDLFNNEVTSTKEYRAKIFELLPSLKILDGRDKDEKEAEESEDEMNGNGSEADAEGDDDLDELEEEEDDEDLDSEGNPQEIGLSALYNDNLNEDSEGDEFDGDEEIEDEDEDDDFNEDEDDLDDSGLEKTADGAAVVTPAGKSAAGDVPPVSGDGVTSEAALTNGDASRGTKRKLEEDDKE